MLDNWENLVVAMSTSTPIRNLKFDDFNNSVRKGDLRHKSIVENQWGEAIALANHGRRIDRG